MGDSDFFPMFLATLYQITRYCTSPGVYILENTPPPGGMYQLMLVEGGNMKRGREKRGKCKRKRKKGEKNEKGKKNGKINIKWGKIEAKRR
jgi:hypothetical protein